MAQCPICLQEVGHLEGHHVIPVEYGGEDLAWLATRNPSISKPIIVDICSTCHHGFHIQALAEMSKNPNRKRKEVFPPDVMERARPFINRIIMSRLEWEAAHPDENPNVRHTVSFSLTPARLAGLHKYKADKGFRSIQSLFDAVVDRMLSSR